MPYRANIIKVKPIKTVLRVIISSVGDADFSEINSGKNAKKNMVNYGRILLKGIMMFSFLLPSLSQGLIFRT